MNDDTPWRLPPVYNGQPAERMSKARRLGITFYFVRALHSYITEYETNANAYIEKALRML